MRELASAIYWTLTGALISFSFLVAFGHIVGIPFMVVGVVMAFVGLVKWWTRGVWAITVGLVALPAYALLRSVLEAGNPSGQRCTPEEGSAEVTLTLGPGESSVSCSPPISDGFVAVVVFLGAIMLSGTAVRLLLFWRGRS